MKNMTFTAALLVACFTSPAMAQAAERPVTLDSDMKLERIVEENGNRTTLLVDPEVVVPGDRLQFVTRYNNVGNETVNDFVITNPVPNSIRVTDDSANELEVSVDGGVNWGKLADLTVTDEEGVVQPAGADDVTHVRWSIAELVPGAAGQVQYSGIVE
ncbi:hypothetical protein [Alteraurantiacibacter aquimixticola]|nr:hypothetical protein [Alteraurantiacibacter aquimixticola]